MTVLNTALRFSLPFNFSKTNLILSSELELSPANLADFTPGCPFRESINKPVSSEKQLISNFLNM